MALSNNGSPRVVLNEKDLSEVVAGAGTSTGGIVIRALKGAINRPVLVTSTKDFVDNFGIPVFTSGSAADGVTPELGYGSYAAINYLGEANALYVVRDYASGDKYATVLFDANGSTSATSATGVDAVSDPNGVADKVDDIYTLDAALPTGKSLLIGALGPGTDGNNIAITLQTYSTCADWIDNYDTYTSATSAGSHPIAEKVFKIKVFTKKDNESWSTLTYADYSASPVETFYGTVSSQLDSNNKQLKIDEVINGNSSYIYVAAGSTDFTAGGSMAAYPTSVTALSGGAVVYGTNLGTTDGWSYFNNKTDVAVNILIVPDYDMTVKKHVATICNTRKDCIMVAQSGGLSATTTATVLAAETYGYTGPSYVALYAGWDQIYDDYNDKKVYVPKCIFGAALMARTDRVANVWDAPAFMERGILGTLSQNKVWSETEVGVLYDKNINSSQRFNGVGDVMWGQKTAQLKKSALDRINVRREILYIENSILPTLLQFVGQPNNSTTRLRVFNAIDSFMSGVDAAGGLSDLVTPAYQVVCDTSNNTSQIIDSNQLVVNLQLAPVRIAEYITLNVTVTRSGVSFA